MDSRERERNGAAGIAGGGRVGQALGRLLRERGVHVACVAGRSASQAAAAASFIGGGARPVALSELPRLAGRVIIAVPDDAVEAVAGILAAAGMNGLALHTSGAFGTEALAALSARGVSCAALHPLQTIATPELGLCVLPGAVFGISGEGPARAWAESLVALLGGRFLPVPEEGRALYHAAAVVASNYAAGLIGAAAMLMDAAGIPEREALDALGPLMRASVENALALGPVQALTGPVARGDLETIRRHLRAMKPLPESLRHFYAAAGLHLVRMAARRVPAPPRIREMEELFSRVDNPHG